MRIFYDDTSDRELIKAQHSEIEYLRAQTSKLESKVDNLQQDLIVARAQAKVASVQAPVQPQPVTKEMIAQKLHIPLSLIDQIDLERLGIQAEGARR